MNQKPVPVAKYPTTCIIGSRDVIEEFLQSIGGPIKRENLKEILTQICMIYLNDSPMAELKKLPDFNRFVKGDILRQIESQEERIHIQKTIFALAQKIHALLRKHGLLNQNDWETDYHFDSFLGNDMVMGYIPY